MSCACGCCEGIEPLTPAAIANRPGLSALRYRAGVHATFLETMEAALSRRLPALGTREPSDFAIALLDGWATVADVLTLYQERIANEGYLRTATERRSIVELARLVGYEPRPGVSASAELAFALEDGYAITIPEGQAAKTVPGTDELPQTFETKEPLEARAAWNRVRPRLSGPQVIDLDDPETYRTLYLAGSPPAVSPGSVLLLDDPRAGDGDIERIVARVASVVRDEDNDRTIVTLTQESVSVAKALALARRLLGAVKAAPVSPSTATTKHVLGVVKAVEASLPHGPQAVARTVQNVLPGLGANLGRLPRGTRVGPWAQRVELALAAIAGALEGDPVAAEQAAVLVGGLEPPAAAPAGAAPADQDGGDPAYRAVRRVLGELARPSSIPPASRTALARDAATLKPPSDSAVRILGALVPALRPQQLYRAWSELAPTGGSVRIWAFRVSASAFGQASQPQPKYTPQTGELLSRSVWIQWSPADDEDPYRVFLDTEYPTVAAPSFAVIETPPNFQPTAFRVTAATTRARAEYGLSGKSTLLAFDEPWWDPHPYNLAAAEGDLSGPFTFILKSVFHVQSERLALAEGPLMTPVEGATVELDGLYDGLAPGRYVIVEGDREVDPALTGAESKPRLINPELPPPSVPAAELALISGVEQRLAELPGATAHTRLTFANRLAYVYRRPTVAIFGNVVGATHGESKSEVLGSGDATQAFQAFPLRQLPLTYLPAPTASGAASTLAVRVNELLWREAPSLADLEPGEHGHLVRIADDGATSVVFGNGEHGARVPTGIENVAATYRSGIGRAGNAAAGQISQLGSKPLGIKEVVNPLPATGGADRDTIDLARRNAPLAVTALDRLVSIQDYEDFARMFAGIGKAAAIEISDGRRRVVHVTIAGVDDIPIAEGSDLFRNLVRALHDLGDPNVPVVLALRQERLLVVQAKVRVAPDYAWRLVEPHVRAAMLAAFSFARRELAEDALASRVIGTIQAVPGVDLVDLDAFGAIGAPTDGDVDFSVALEQRVRARPAELGDDGVLRAAELAILDPAVPDTLLLSELKP